MRISDWSSDVCSSDLLARPAGAVLARGAVGRAFVAGVAAPAVAAAQKDEPFALFRQVGEQAAILVVGEDLGPDRHLDDQFRAARTGAVAPGAGDRKSTRLNSSH